jgi:hypothetical protein
MTGSFVNIDLRTAPPPVLGDLPWGYVENRIAALARDPQWIFVYWEILDDAIEKARAQAKDPHAGCALRVYDTTYRDFDGLNAHHYWDLRVDRSSKGHYLHTGRPGATFHVDIGVLSGGGLFAPIARSNACETPRDSASPDGTVEWSTVYRSGPAPAYRHRHVPKPGSPAPPPPAEIDRVFESFAAEGWKRREWIEEADGGRVVRRIRWTGPFTVERFPIAPAGTYKTLEVLFQGERRSVRSVEGGETSSWGPWTVVLEGVGAQGERRTVHQWMVRHRWTGGGGSERIDTPAVLSRVAGGERVRSLVQGSETRLERESWGSEWLQLGASEWRWIGGSETLLAGASELLQLGASEVARLGSSDVWFLGASENHGSRT